MRNLNHPLARALCAASAVFLLNACDRRAEDKTAGQKLDAAIERTEDAAAATARKATELGKAAREKTDAYIESGEARRDAETVKGALKEAGNTLESKAGDAATAVAVSAALARDPELSALRIDVDSRAGAVRLSGPAPNAEAKARAETLARAVDGVTSVDNQLVIGTPR